MSWPDDQYAELLQFTETLLDGCVYEIDEINNPIEICLRSAVGGVAFSFNLASNTFSSLQGRWTLARVRSFPYWRIEARALGNDAMVAAAAPAFLGYNSYTIRIGSGTRFRMTTVAADVWHWKVNRRVGRALELRRRDDWKLTVHSTGLSQTDLSVLVGMAPLMERTNAIDNRAGPDSVGGN